jgi:hypothetical protein
MSGGWRRYDGRSPKVLTHRQTLSLLCLYPHYYTMGQQLNKIIKRKRRAAYLKRKKVAAAAAKKK